MKILFKTNLQLFFLLILIVGISQYLLFGLALKYGFTPDDWGLLFFYKTLGNNPLAQIPYVWSVKGAYTTGPIYFIGILNDFFNFHYQYFQITNIVLKTLATLALFPLTLVVFKRRLLAFLTTILYGMSYMASRSLEYVVKGTDYLAIIPMSIFFIIYYYIVNGRLKGIWWYILMGFFWFSSLMISPIRIYPILVLIPLIEIYLWIQQRSRNNLLNSLKRLLMLYTPFILIYLYKPSSILSFLQNPPVIFKAILDGNWHLILTPFQGVGLTLLTVGFWSNLINNGNLVGLGEYLSFLVRGPFIVFGFFTAVLAIIKSGQPKRFFLHAFFSNLILNILFYFLAVRELSIPENLRLNFDPTRIYPIIISGFMLAISFASFLEWRKLDRRDNILLALWISPVVGLLYTFLIWLLAPFGVGFEGQQGYYLVLPAIAASLFLAAILVAITEFGLSQRSKVIRIFISSAVVVFLFYLYSLNRNDIIYFISSGGINGRYALDQDRMYNQVLYQIRDNIKSSELLLFYFDVFEDANRGTFYTEALLSNLAVRLRIKDGTVTGRCIGVFYQDLSSLEKLVIVKGNAKGFMYKSHCGEEFFNVNNFYAFKVKNGQLTDIKQKVLEKLGF